MTEFPGLVETYKGKGERTPRFLFFFSLFISLQQKMFATSRLFSIAAKRTFSTSAANLSKVAVLGAAGGIGQPLSLLLKENPHVTHLSLYDIVNAPGVAADIGHINTNSIVTGHTPENDGLKEALTDAHVVVIPAGIPRKPGMTRDDLFNTNASIVRDLATAAAK